MLRLLRSVIHVQAVGEKTRECSEQHERTEI